MEGDTNEEVQDLGIGLLPLVLASCGTSTATKDSQDVTEKGVTGTSVQKIAVGFKTQTF
ncbi:hypothetical protein [Enterococcus faecalis]|uniref:hypothetical protein n=1 Tax=Enterococcus faecalis TaxID=1351 RepID=UPI002091CC54|nr:hypothetical protein [Enterococcus faecalis]MCO5542308.1 hypothetical protein [Enterococcus faecalis]